MALSDFYPTPRDLIANEVKVLDRLMDDPYIVREHQKFAIDARKYRDRYKDLRGGFEFISYFDIYHSQVRKRGKAIRGREQANLRLLVASTIQRKGATYGNISYCLAVCGLRSGNTSIMRKFHFDVTANSQPGRQQHPVCHLQYGGGMISLMAEAGLRQSQVKQVHIGLDEPRIFFWPMSLALLIDMTLHEFPDDSSKKFRATPEWRGIVRENENLILRRFYETCIGVIANHGHQNRTLADEFYVA